MEDKNKMFLALELTKITPLEEESTPYSIFMRYLKDLNNIDDINEIVSLKEELEYYKKKAKALESYDEEDEVNILKAKLISIIQSCKGDMEPYVYDTLISIVNDK